jgi:hypothetical protein
MAIGTSLEYRLRLGKIVIISQAVMIITRTEGQVKASPIYQLDITFDAGSDRSGKQGSERAP